MVTQRRRAAPDLSSPLDLTVQTRSISPNRRRPGLTLPVQVLSAILISSIICSYLYYLRTASINKASPSSRNTDTLQLHASLGDPLTKEVTGHGDFDDGRKRTVNPAFLVPESNALYWVNVMLGNGGYVRTRTRRTLLKGPDQNLT
jgi:hypothetical protein